MLAESGAIVEYIIGKYGNGRLALPPSHPDFAQYLYWFHFSNSNLMSILGRNMTLNRLKLSSDDPNWLASQARLSRSLTLLNVRLADATYLAGDEFTAADVMIVFSLTTMRLFYDFDLTPYPNIKTYLARIGKRDGYRRAMHAGDPDVVPMLG